MSVSTKMSIQDKMTARLNKISAAFHRTESATKAADNNIKQMERARDFGASKAQLAAEKAEQMRRKQEDIAAGGKKIESVWSKIRNIIATVGITAAARKTLELADTMTQTRARLDLMNDGLQTTERLQNKIMASANRSRAVYTDVANTVSKLGILAGDAFKSNNEMIAFTELMNKNFVVGGAAPQEQAAAMYQLTQAMAAGKLQGDEFRSIMENAPLLAQAIADFTGKSKGELKEMSAEGTITAEIIKGALFASADEINARFATMPMTFAQVGTIAGNMLLQAFDPAIQAIGQGAQWICDNWSMLAPVFTGVSVALGIYAGAQALAAAKTWLTATALGTQGLAVGAYNLVIAIASFLTGNMVLAQTALNTAMAACPILIIAAIIGIIIYQLYKWVQSVGGLRVAWLIVCDAVLSGWDAMKLGFFTGVYWVQGLMDKMTLGFRTAGVNIINFMGDMKAGVLTILQNMVNGAIGIINGFISMLNNIPGVNIGVIEQVTFGTTAQLENEAAKQSRARDLSAYQDEINGKTAERDAALGQMKANAWQNERSRKMGIAAARQESADSASDSAMNIGVDSVDRVGSVGKVEQDINIAEEDLKFLRDVAEMRYIQNFVTLTPTVAMNANISEKVDVKNVVAEIERKLEEEFAAEAEGVYV